MFYDIKKKKKKINKKICCENLIKIKHIIIIEKYFPSAFIKSHIKFIKTRSMANIVKQSGRIMPQAVKQGEFYINFHEKSISGKLKKFEKFFEF